MPKQTQHLAKDERMEVDEMLRQLDIPAELAHTPISRTEGKFMHDWVKRHGLTRTLEVGLALGASATSIMSAHADRHICIDPFQESVYKRAGLRNVAKFGFGDRLRHLPELSHSALPKLLAENRRFDFAFIDGNHLYDGIFIDFYFVDLMLEQNGYVLFHDAWMRGTQLVASFIRRNRADYRAVRIPVRNLLMFQKVGCDERNWDHFREFYTLRSFFVHPIVRWLLNRGYFRPQPKAVADSAR